MQPPFLWSEIGYPPPMQTSYVRAPLVIYVTAGRQAVVMKKGKIIGNFTLLLQFGFFLLPSQALEVNDSSLQGLRKGGGGGGSVLENYVK